MVIRTVGGFLTPGYLVVGWIVAQVTIRNSAVALVTAVLMFTVATPLAWSRFTRDGRAEAKESAHKDWLGTVSAGFLMMASATVGCALASALLLGWGLGDKDSDATNSSRVNQTYEASLWQLAHAVPLLEIPDALSWKRPPLEAPKVQGILIIAYEVGIILPVLYLGGLLLSRTVADEVAKSAPPNSEA